MWVLLLIILVVIAAIVISRRRSDTFLVLGGAARTWKALTKNPIKHDKHRLSRDEIVNRIPYLNWGIVHKQLRPAVLDDHEWVGLIDIKNGNPVIIQKERGGKGHISPEQLKKYTERQAMFLFHTHTKGTCGIPTAADIAASLDSTHNSRFAGHVVVSENGLYVYGATDDLINKIWSDPAPRLAILTHMYDVYTMMEGRRSWNNWSMAEFKSTLRRYGIMFHAVNNEAPHKKCFKSSSSINYEYINKMHTWIREEEDRVRKKI